MTDKQQAITKLFQKAERLQNTADLIRDLIPDNLPCVAHIWGTEDSIRICLPYNIHILRKVRRSLGKDWRFNRSWISHLDDSKKSLAYDHKNGADLIITLDADVVGSTCRIKQVGVKEVPIYEIVCN